MRNLIFLSNVVHCVSSRWRTRNSRQNGQNYQFIIYNFVRNFAGTKQRIFRDSSNFFVKYINKSDTFFVKYINKCLCKLSFYFFTLNVSDGNFMLSSEVLMIRNSQRFLSSKLVVHSRTYKLTELWTENVENCVRFDSFFLLHI